MKHIWRYSIIQHCWGKNKKTQVKGRVQNCVIRVAAIVWRRVHSLGFRGTSTCPTMFTQRNLSDVVTHLNMNRFSAGMGRLCFKNASVPSLSCLEWAFMEKSKKKKKTWCFSFFCCNLSLNEKISIDTNHPLMPENNSHIIMNG